MRLLRRLAAVLLALAAAVLALLLLAAPASAHAVVVSSSPADGARLDSAPASVRIRFDEPVGLDLGYLRVVDSAGSRVDAGAASHPNSDGTTIQVALRSGLGDGSYLASYRVTSADSHPVAGSIRFVVGDGPLVTPTGSSGSAPESRAVSSLLAISHWLSFAGVAVVGGSWLIFTVWPSGRWRPEVRRLIWTGWLVAVAGAVAEFLLQGPYSAGTGLGSALRGTLLDATLHVNSGQLLSVRLVLLGVLGFVFAALFAGRLGWVPELAAIVGVGIVVSYAASGHSESVNPRWLAVLVVALHLTAMIVWLGGLSVLLTAAVTRRRRETADWAAEPADWGAEPADRLAEPADWGAEPAVERGEPVAVGAELAAAAELAGPADWTSGAGDPDYPIAADELPELDEYADDEASRNELAAGLPVFSRVALICICMLGVTGLLQAWREIRTVDAITTTRYGQLVLLKVVLFVGIVALGYLARRALRRPGSPLVRLRRTLLIEVVVGAAVLAATGVLIAQPPGNVALAAQRSKPRLASVAVTTKSNAVVEVDPGVHGPVQVSVQLTGGLKPISVSATASLPAKQLGPIPVTLQPSGAGSYTASGVLLPAAGTWQLQLTVRTSEFDSTTAVAELKVY